MKKSVFYLAALLGGLSTASAQQPWTLQDCFRYALDHNTTLQKQELQIEQDKISLNTSQLSRLPDLGASLSGNMSFGRSLTVNNTYENRNTLSGSLGVSASLPVFMGGRINHQIKSDKLALRAAEKDLARLREDLTINITALYLDVLYCKEKVGIAERQVAISTEQVATARDQVDVGRVAQSVLYENEALLAVDELLLAQQQGALSLALLSLSQALNRPDAEGFDVVMPEMGSAVAQMSHLRNPQELYAYALDNRPGIESERIRLERAMRLVKSARSAFYPSISLSGGYGTNVYKVFSGGVANPSFGDQFRNNSNEYVGLSVNIPIFNRQATRNGVRSARVGVQTQQVVLTETEQAMRKEIESAYYTADAALAQYHSAEKAFESAQIAFRYEAEKYAAGRSTTFDYDSAKTRSEKAESDLLQAKYEFIFRAKVLDFYAGMPLTL